MGHIQSLSLKTRVTLFTLLIFVIGVASLTLLASRMLHQDLQKLLSAQQFAAVSIVAEDIESALKQRQSGLENVGGRIDPAMFANPALLQTFLENRPVLLNMFNGGLFVTDQRGIATASLPVSLNRIGINYQDRDYIQAALKEGKTSIGMPVMGKQIHAPIFVMATPIRNTKGVVIGALAGVVDLSKPNFLDQIQLNRSGKAGDYLLVSPQHRLIITSSDKSRVMEALPPAGVSPAIDHFIAGNEGSKIFVSPRGIEVLASVKKIPAAGWYIASTLPSSEVFAPIHEMQQHMLQAALILIVLIGGAIWWNLRRQLSPMLNASQALSSMAANPATAQPLPISSHDEFGLVLTGFNALLAAFHERDLALKKNQERLQSYFTLPLIGIAITSIEKGWLEVNQRLCDIFGYSRDELVNMSWPALTHPDDLAGDLAEFNRVLEGETQGYTLEKRFIRKDGAVIDAEISVRCVRHDDGTIDYFVALVQDISKRKQAEAEVIKLNSSLEERVRQRSSELLATELQMRSIIDASGDGIIEVDRAGNILLANPAVCTMLGLTADELHGCNLYEKIHPSHPDGQHYPIEDCPTAKAIAQGTSLRDSEQVFWHANGTPVLVSVSVQAIRHGEEVLGGVMNITDISARKLAEQSIKDSEEFKTAILDAMPAEIAVLDQNGVIIAVNATWQRFAEENGALPMRSQSGTNYLDVCRQGIEAASPMAEAAYDGIRAILEGRLPDFTLEYPCHSEQEERWFAMSVSPLQTHQQGAVVSHTNITERKRAEARRSLLEYALNQVDEAAYLMSQGGGFEYVNEGAVHQLGYSREELLKMDVADLDHNFPKSAWPALWAKVREEKAIALETRHWRKDGSEMPVEIHANYLSFENQDYCLVLARDITKRREMLRQQNEAIKAAENLARIKSEFLANMSHEIRTPLNGVLGMAQIGYRESFGHDRSHDIFARILGSGKLLLGIINDILDFSKIEAGKLVLESAPVDPCHTINMALETQRERCQEKGIELKLDLADNLPVAFNCDPVRLSQILLNLLSNAVKFTTEGEVRVSVFLVHDEIVFRISDSGIGMSQTQLVRLFQPFEQADSSTTRKYGGTGLGLSISRRLAEIMGGNIQVTSLEGVGSTFELHLPCTPAELGLDLPATLIKIVSAGNHLQGVRILAAEDNEMNQLVLRDLLDQEGAHVTMVANGQLAVAALSEADADFDIVLMDAQMPIMDGLAATRRIRETHPFLPIIGQTAHALAEEHARCRAAGMNAVITKPLDVDNLVAVILEHLGKPGQASRSNSPQATKQRPPPETALDWAMLEKKYPLKHDFVSKICNAFLASYADGPARIREATTQDLEELAVLAHSLKGSAGSLLAHEVVASAKTLEEALRANAPEIGQNAEQLALALEATLHEITNHIKRSKSSMQ